MTAKELLKKVQGYVDKYGDMVICFHPQDEDYAEEIRDVGISSNSVYRDVDEYEDHVADVIYIYL